MEPEGLRRTERLVLLACAVLVGVAVAVFLRTQRLTEPVAITTDRAVEGVKVHVVGEVVWPGLYELKGGARVQDAILAAHGPTYTADLRRVNLAAPLHDGDRVIVPKIVIPTPYPRMVDSHPGKPAPAQPGRDPPSPAASPAGEPSDTVNVNTATAADLQRLPGIGPVLARRIVEHREAKGLFRRVDDLGEVKGIGPKLLARVRALVRLE